MDKEVDVKTQAIQILELPEDLPKRDKAHLILRANGFTVKDTYELAGGKKDHCESAPYVREKAVKSKSVVNPKLVELAHKAIEETLAMTPQPVTRTMVTKAGEAVTYKDNLYPSHTNRMEAARMIVDRDEPAVQKHVNMNLNAEVSVDLVDLKPYRDAPDNTEEVKDADFCDVTNTKPSQNTPDTA